EHGARLVTGERRFPRREIGHSATLLAVARPDGRYIRSAPLSPWASPADPFRRQPPGSPSPRRCLCYFPCVVNAGDVIENPVTGERITFVRTSQQTGGALAELDLELSPTAFLAAEHIHRSQEEKFQVLDGHILLRCRGQESMSGPGQTVAVPPGAPHAWAPHGGGARVR